MAQHAGNIVGLDAQNIDQKLELKAGIFDAHGLLIIDRLQDGIELAIQKSDQMFVCCTYCILQL